MNLANICGGNKFPSIIISTIDYIFVRIFIQLIINDNSLVLTCGSWYANLNKFLGNIIYKFSINLKFQPKFSVSCKMAKASGLKFSTPLDVPLKWVLPAQKLWLGRTRNFMTDDHIFKCVVHELINYNDIFIFLQCRVSETFTYIFTRDS